MNPKEGKSLSVWDVCSHWWRLIHWFLGSGIHTGDTGLDLELWNASGMRGDTNLLTCSVKIMNDGGKSKLNHYLHQDQNECFWLGYTHCWLRTNPICCLFPWFSWLLGFWAISKDRNKGQATNKKCSFLDCPCKLQSVKGFTFPTTTKITMELNSARRHQKTQVTQKFIS